MRLLRPLALLLLLPACSNHLGKLEQANPSADDYLSALAAEYKDYAASEKELGHPFKGEYFAKKGTTALDGNPVAPDDVQKGMTPEDTLALTKAREDLVKLQTDDMKHACPRKLARAQLLFDCWQNQTATRAANQSSVPCADEFGSTLVDLQKTADHQIAGQTTHIVTFVTGSTRITTSAGQIIDEVVGGAKENERYTVQLDGHLEEMLHAPDYRLTEARMEAVRAALVSRGIPDEKIELLKPKAEGRVTPVMLSIDRPRKPSSVDINVRTYSAGEKLQ